MALDRIAAPTAAFYRDLYDRVGRPWLWYERRLLSDAALSALLDQPGHELHVARHDGAWSAISNWPATNWSFSA